MATGKTGGLNWHGVGRPSGSGQQTTRVDTLLNKTKASRQKEAMRAPKVGSAAIVSADDWLASAAANREAMERNGAVGNPFASADTLVKESNRQASRRSEFDIDEEAVDPEWLSFQEGWRSPGFYAGGQDESPSLPSPKAATPAEPQAREESRREEATRASASGGISRQRMREVELLVRTFFVACQFNKKAQVMKLRDELEDRGESEDVVDAECDALREKLLQQHS